VLTAAGAALVLVAAGCGSEQAPQAVPGATEPAATTSPAPTLTPTPAASPAATALEATVPVYYLTDTGTQLRLAREFRQVAAPDGPAVAAVAAMLQQPALDPDYSSPWNPATQVLAVAEQGGTITVDVTADARAADVGAEAAERAVQQLVYTVTAALQSNADVQLLVDGQPAGELWGHVVWDEPIGRAPALDVRLLVQVNEPAQGATVPPTFTVSGEAAVFEANLPWRVETPSGDLVVSGAAMTAEGQRFAPYEFEVTLPEGAEPGEYVLVVEEDDPSGGEGRPVMRDTKTVVVE
jgi:hypothetical protein